MADIGNMAFVADRAEGTDGADRAVGVVRADGTEGDDVAKMAGYNMTFVAYMAKTSSIMHILFCQLSGNTLFF